MAGVKEFAEALARRVLENVGRVDEEELEAFVEAVGFAGRVFVVGAGRSGLVARAFAMRLMHLGMQVYVVGETITPAIGPGDLLVAVSGSGATRSVVLVAGTARRLGARVAAVTSHRESQLARLADVVLVVGGREEGLERDYVSEQLKGFSVSPTPLGTLFELSASIVLDAVVAALMEKRGVGEEVLKARHTNLE